VSLLPSPFKSIGKFLPSNAGQALIYGSSRGNTNDLLAPWVGFSVFCAETAAVMAVAAVVLTRRDV
jgi:ABC-type transport system involved in multi-copper enzyme maturation permease subunit